MNYQEAKERFAKERPYLENHDWKIAYYLAEQAFEKQIPKKVKYKNRHGDGADLWNLDYYNCPACGRRLRNKQHDPYCGRCGQALDWGDE